MMKVKRLFVAPLLFHAASGTQHLFGSSVSALSLVPLEKGRRILERAIDRMRELLLEFKSRSLPAALSSAAEKLTAGIRRRLPALERRSPPAVCD
jgi:hypothetical protein